MEERKNKGFEKKIILDSETPTRENGEPADKKRDKNLSPSLASISQTDVSHKSDLIMYILHE